MNSTYTGHGTTITVQGSGSTAKVISCSTTDGASPLLSEVVEIFDAIASKLHVTAASGEAVQLSEEQDLARYGQLRFRSDSRASISRTAIMVTPYFCMEDIETVPDEVRVDRLEGWLVSELLGLLEQLCEVVTA